MLRRRPLTARLIPRLCAALGLFAAAPFAAGAPGCSAISLLPLPSATAGVPYSTALSNWTLGGMPPYSYSSAVLPTGLTADSTGNITGTPSLRDYRRLHRIGHGDG